MEASGAGVIDVQCRQLPEVNVENHGRNMRQCSGRKQEFQTAQNDSTIQSLSSPSTPEFPCRCSVARDNAISYNATHRPRGAHSLKLPWQGKSRLVYGKDGGGGSVPARQQVPSSESATVLDSFSGHTAQCRNEQTKRLPDKFK